jgi:hypothetical protein
VLGKQVSKQISKRVCLTLQGECRAGMCVCLHALTAAKLYEITAPWGWRLSGSPKRRRFLYNWYGYQPVKILYSRVGMFANRTLAFCDAGGGGGVIGGWRKLYEQDAQNLYPLSHKGCHGQGTVLVARGWRGGAYPAVAGNCNILRLPWFISLCIGTQQNTLLR